VCEAVNRFDGLSLSQKILSIDAVPQTVKRFSRFELGPLTPNLKLGENEKFNFSYGL